MNLKKVAMTCSEKAMIITQVKDLRHFHSRLRLPGWSHVGLASCFFAAWLSVVWQVPRQWTTATKSAPIFMVKPSRAIRCWTNKIWRHIVLLWWMLWHQFVTSPRTSVWTLTWTLALSACWAASLTKSVRLTSSSTKCTQESHAAAPHRKSTVKSSIRWSPVLATMLATCSALSSSRMRHTQYRLKVSDKCLRQRYYSCKTRSWRWGNAATRIDLPGKYPEAAQAKIFRMLHPRCPHWRQKIQFLSILKSRTSTTASVAMTKTTRDLKLCPRARNVQKKKTIKICYATRRRQKWMQKLPPESKMTNHLKKCWQKKNLTKDLMSVSIRLLLERKKFLTSKVVKAQYRNRKQPPHQSENLIQSLAADLVRQKSFNFLHQ